jgi:CRISPR/Cas system-associated exonuclease Cas4 (RecB family)
VVVYGRPIWKDKVGCGRIEKYIAMAMILSPNSLNLFLECPHCFWLEKRMGIKRPPNYPFSLNLAVDELLKEEFDDCRQKGIQPALLDENGIGAKLFSNKRLLSQWRNNLQGIRYYDKALQATLLGAPDDVLEFENGKIAPLDYKSTGSQAENIYDKFQLQMDIYTFLMEKNGYKTSHKGYLAFYIIDKSRGVVDRLPFRKKIIEIETNPSDIYEIFVDAVSLLNQETPPPHSQDCQFGKWISKISLHQLKNI